MVVLIVSITVVSLLAGFFLYKMFAARKEYLSIYNKYKDIINYDSELNKRKNEISSLSEKQIELEKEYSKKIDALNSEYTKYKAIFDNLQKEISLTEETLELHSFGVYKPHYTFATSDEYKSKLEEIYDKQKDLIKSEKAAFCSTQWTVSGSKAQGERMTKHYMKLMLRAFNGECDSNIMKVKWNNVVVMEERIKKAYEAINKLGAIHQITITQDYLDLKLQELRLAYEYDQKLYHEKEEQRRIREQMREEEKVQREIEQAQKETADEEKRYQKALDKARSEIERAKGEELEELSSKMKLLEQQLKEAQERKERALSRAQLTKSGHVYIISNIGSFGENVYKIGMTRRLEPIDRVKELGDASVPFEFDVHALIYSENAPELEYKLQERFYDKRINMVNDRKEFFEVTLDELEKFAKENEINIQITKIAEAQEYRETLALREKAAQEVENKTTDKYPEKLI